MKHLRAIAAGNLHHSWLSSLAVRSQLPSSLCECRATCFFRSGCVLALYGHPVCEHANARTDEWCRLTWERVDPNCAAMYKPFGCGHSNGFSPVWLFASVDPPVPAEVAEVIHLVVAAGKLADRWRLARAAARLHMKRSCPALGHVPPQTAMWSGQMPRKRPCDPAGRRPVVVCHANGHVGGGGGGGAPTTRQTPGNGGHVAGSGGAGVNVVLFMAPCFCFCFHYTNYGFIITRRRLHVRLRVIMKP